MLKILMAILLVLGPACLATAGDVLWFKNFSSERDYADVTFSMAMDENGNIYTAGLVSHPPVPGTGYPINHGLIIKYSSEGERVWVRDVGQFSDVLGHLWDIVYDGSGNIYVGGLSTSVNSNTAWDFSVIKYSTDGDSLWSYVYPTAGPIAGNEYSNDVCRRLAIDGDGNIYAAGMRNNGANRADFLVVKLTPEGEVLWTSGANESYINDDVLEDLVVDEAGNAYISGSIPDENWHYRDVVIKYHAEGTTAWVDTTAMADTLGRGSKLTIDGDGNLYAFSRSGGQNYLIKYAGNGDHSFSIALNGAIETGELAVDNSGNVIISHPNQSYRQLGSGIIITKYSAEGDEIWSDNYAAPANRVYGPVKIMSDSSNNTYLLHSVDSAYSYHNNYEVLRFDESGALIAKRTCPLTLSPNFFAGDMGIDPAGNIFISGAADFPATGEDAVSIKHCYYICGDGDGNEVINILDISYFIRYLYKQGPAPRVLSASDADGNGATNILDVARLVNFLYRGGPEPLCR
ncbi:exported hypothetical protein [Candidatus Zixiibacteriota bacterium]|nr:exported hypothetical protein [candidate division Zixibacteria bacterium]